jgi:TolB protein
VVAVAPVPAAEPAVVRLTSDGLLKQRPAWSPDGATLAFTRHQGATIFLFLRAADGTERRLTSRTDPEFDACWSPDGKRLAFTLDKTVPNQGYMDVYTIGVDGEGLEPVLTTGGKLSHEEWPTWSPDGQWIALTSTRDGNQEVYAVRLSDKQARRLTSDPAIDAHPAWSPDGKRLAFATNRWGDLEIAVMNIDGTNLLRLTDSRGLDDYPTWSPDGKRLVFTSNRDGNFEIYTCDPGGLALQNETQHPALDHFATFAPSGALTWVSNRAGSFDIYEHTRFQP